MLICTPTICCRQYALYSLLFVCFYAVIFACEKKKGYKLCLHTQCREHINLISVLLFDFACGTAGTPITIPGTTLGTSVIQECQENIRQNIVLL